ncbi:MAG: alkaline phosphatase family protein, partial [Acidobacteriaceae bacterium]
GADHGWTALHECWNSGRLDQWVPTQRKHVGADGPYCMCHYNRSDIPFQFALADAFTICDAYHCSVLGPTYPNRMYWMTGTIDSEGHDGGPMTDNAPMGRDDVPHTRNGYTWTTYAERLELAGISWKVYRGIDDFGLNMLKYFRSFRDAQKGSSLYTRGAMERGPDGEFEYDAVNDKLPTVSWIIPDKHESEHPDDMPAVGASYIASKIDAIAANPDVWAKTVFILDYDENDGLFDHVPPPVPPPGTPLEFVDGLPIGGGFRVPCILVSPWTAGGWVCSEPFDHTSVLRFLELFTGVREPNISDWRRQTFGDLTSPFRFHHADNKPPTLPSTAGRLNRALYEAAHLPLPSIPGEDQHFPKQEKGSRKRVF